MNPKSISEMEAEIDWHKDDIRINEEKIERSKRKIDQYRRDIQEKRNKKNSQTD